jgi:hypothetical protein
MKPKLLLGLALVLSGVWFGSGCATSRSDACECKTIQRFDYPGLNNDTYRYMYAFPWKQQLSLYEQQGWRVDSIKTNETGLASGHPIDSAIIVLKRDKNP